MEVVKEVASSFLGIVRISVFVSTIVLLSALIANVYSFVETLPSVSITGIDGLFNFMHGIIRLVEGMFIVTLMSESVVPYLPTEKNISFEMTFLGVTRIPRMTVYGSLLLVCAGADIRYVEFIVNGEFSDIIHEYVLDCRLLLYALGLLSYTASILFDEDVVDVKEITGSYWRVSRYYESNVKTSVGVYGFWYGVSMVLSLLCYLSISIYLNIRPFVIDSDGVSETQFLVNSVLIFILIVYVLVYLRRVIYSTVYVTHSAEIVLLLYVSLRIIVGLYDSFADIYVLQAIIPLIIWVLPIIFYVLDADDLSERIFLNTQDLVVFVVENLFDMRKWSRLLFPAAVITSGVSLVFIVLSLSGPLFEVNYGVGGSVGEMVNAASELNQRFEVVTTAVADATRVLQPCQRTYRGNLDPSSSTPSRSINGTTWSDPSMTLAEDTSRCNGGNIDSSVFAVNGDLDKLGCVDTGTWASPLSPECQQYKSSMTESCTNAETADTTQEYSSGVSVVDPEQSISYDEECMQIQCIVMATALASAIALTLIPFVNIAAVPARILVRVGRMIFQLGVKIAKATRFLLRKKASVLRVINVMRKLEQFIGSGVIAFTEKMVYTSVPSCSTLLFGIFFGFWSRDLPMGAGSSFTFVVFFLSNLVVNGLLYWIVLEIPNVIESVLDDVPGNLITLEVSETIYYTLLKHAFLVGMLNCVLWIVVFVLNFIGSLMIIPFELLESEVQELLDFFGWSPDPPVKVGTVAHNWVRGRSVGAAYDTPQKRDRTISLGEVLFGLGMIAVGLFFFVESYQNGYKMVQVTGLGGEEMSSIRDDLASFEVTSSEGESVFHGSDEKFTFCDLVEFTVKEAVGLVLDTVVDAARSVFIQAEKMSANGLEFLSTVVSDFGISVTFPELPYLIFIIHFPSLLVTLMFILLLVVKMFDFGNGWVKALVYGMLPVQVSGLMFLLGITGIVSIVDAMKTPVLNIHVTDGPMLTNAMYHAVINLVACVYVSISSMYPQMNY